MQQRYPLSAKYDIDWILENQMGSHCLWLLEALCQSMSLTPGMRVLDLGCGKAITSIFLAKEFNLQVWATDLRVAAGENWKRICAAGVQNQVFPLHADARNLPYAHDFFDAIVSINALQFFGTDELYLQDHLLKVVKPGGQIGIVVPGLRKEFDGDVPDYLAPYWQTDFFTWHAPSWWQKHWGKTNLVDIETADNFADREGYQMFLKFGLAVESGDKLLPADNDRNISFVRFVARKKNAA
jgi:cyclopropane fatty-acyl-phospholipid synthase-like methyltransferase